MSDVREMRIFAADQIQVHPDLPSILKAFSKEVIRQVPENVVTFSRQYFEQVLKQQGYQFEKQEEAETSGVEPKVEKVYKVSAQEEDWGIVTVARRANHRRSGAERVIVQK